MKLKNTIPVTLSVVLAASLGYLVNQEPVLSVKSSTEQSKDKESESIEGALRSVYSMRLNEVTGTIEPEWVQLATSQADALRLQRRLNKAIVWEGMGPDNVGGRIRAFMIHRDSGNLWFAGGVSGGLFRSTTGGQSWRPVNDNQENLNVNCIAQSVEGTIYYGTGEGGFTNLSGTRNGSPAFMGNGVYKSSDNRGTSFSLVSVAKDSRFFECNGMAAHPTEDKILIATSTGLFALTDKGTKITSLRNGNWKEVKMDKNGIAWATIGSGAMFKIDGTTVTAVAGFTSPGGRVAIGISPQDPNYIYACGAAGNGAFAGLWRTTDGGATWTKLVNQNSQTDLFGSNNQGWYDNVVGVDPNNKNRVIMGGVQLASWDEVNGYREVASTFGAPWNVSYVHADKHIVEWNTRTNPPTLIVGCDGGLFSTQNESVWTSINRGFTTLQLYNVAANEKGHVVGGAQDNGTQLINFSGNSFNGKPSQTAISIYGGDGFDVEFSRFDPNTVFMSTYYGNVVRSGNSGQASSSFWDTRQDGKVQSDFNTTYCLWESAPKVSRLFLAKNSEVWMAKNPTNFTEDVEWYIVAKNLGNDRIVEMDYTPDGDHLFICKFGKLLRLDSINSATFTLDANPSVTTVPTPITLNNITPSGMSGRTITSVNVNQSNPEHVVITLGGYGNTVFVYETKNALDVTPTWKNITGNLPSMPVYDAVIDVDDDKRIILGTDFGIWASEDGGNTWVEANNGMARVPVFEIRAYEWRPWEGMVMYVGTHGRGYFKSNSLMTNTKKVTKSEITALRAYPNPTVNQVNLEYNNTGRAGVASVIVRDIQGRIVEQRSVNVAVGANTIEVSLQGKTAGYYFAEVNVAGKKSVAKIIKN